MKGKLICMFCVLMTAAILLAVPVMASREPGHPEYAEENRNAHIGGIVLTGSSLCEQFPIDKILEENQDDFVIYNRGYGGYTMPKLMDVLDTAVLDLAPSALFINIGTNDIDRLGDEYTYTDMMENYRTILTAVQTEYPSCVIYVMAYYPCTPNTGTGQIQRTLAQIEEANTHVEALVQELGCEYISVNDVLSDENGYLKAEYAADSIHLTEDAYRVIYQELRPYFEKCSTRPEYLARTGSSAGVPAAPMTENTSNTADMTPSSYSHMTSYDKRDDTGHIYIGHDVTDSEDIVLNDTVSGAGYTAVYAHGNRATANVTGAIAVTDDTNGEFASDFSGQGAVIVANDDATAEIRDAEIYSSGFERTALLISQGGTVTAENSRFTVLGADPLTGAYEGYMNSANQSVMLSPPWALGIQGGARVVNMLGENPTLTVCGCKLTAGGWALFSTDAGSNMRINSVDSDLHILTAAEGGMDSGWRIFGYDENAYGSGYGSFYIGGSTQYHYGEIIDGVTYGAIFGNGSGSAHYASSRGSIDLYDATDSLLQTVEGQGRDTVINCVFGFLAHRQVMDGVYVEDGTEIHAEDAVVIYKNGSSDWYFDNCKLNSAKGVLFQMMDNDDDTRIGNRPDGNGFNTVYDESRVAAGDGFPGINYDYISAVGGDAVTVTYTDGVYEGDIYNGTGYYGQKGDNLSVTIGKGATLTGDIALTSTVKGLAYSADAMEGIAHYGDDIDYILLDKNGAACNASQAVCIQIHSYTINEYFLQGHVENRHHYNGASTVEVTATAGSVWNVEDQSLITKLTIEKGAVVKGVLTENADGTLTITAGDNSIPAGIYGSIEAVIAASGEQGGGSREPSVEAVR